MDRISSSLDSLARDCHLLVKFNFWTQMRICASTSHESLSTHRCTSSFRRGRIMLTPPFDCLGVTFLISWATLTTSHPQVYWFGFTETRYCYLAWLVRHWLCRPAQPPTCDCCSESWEHRHTPQHVAHTLQCKHLDRKLGTIHTSVWSSREIGTSKYWYMMFASNYL